jgi:hypothetical protein
MKAQGAEATEPNVLETNSGSSSKWAIAAPRRALFVVGLTLLGLFQLTLRMPEVAVALAMATVVTVVL